MHKVSFPFLGTYLEISSDGESLLTIGLSKEETPSELSLLVEARKQLVEYGEGRRKEFDLPVDLRECSPFQRKVLEELRKVPYGETVSYSELAKRVGCKSPRAIGQALHRNPLPILIPCHRVVGRDGRITGFALGVKLKEALLQLEEKTPNPSVA